MKSDVEMQVRQKLWEQEVPLALLSRILNSTIMHNLSLHIQAKSYIPLRKVLPLKTFNIKSMVVSRQGLHDTIEA